MTHLFLADENIPPKTIKFLRGLGYKVVDLREEGNRSVADDEIMELAKKRDLVLITLDKHFANIVKYPPENHSGIIRIRIHPPLLADINIALKSLLEKVTIDKIRGNLIILEKTGYRIRRSS